MTRTLHNEDYDAALGVLEQALMAFCSGESERGEELLLSLDRDAIERVRAHLRQLARQAQPFKGARAANLAKRSIPKAVQSAVCQRDRYQCRFTGRRLIETDVFKELARVSRSFHFDEHHSVRATKRGPGGHPIVRTHGAAFEHAMTPHSHGGDTTFENLALISVELNEGKSNLVLPLLTISPINWSGLTEYLPRLRDLPSAETTRDNVVSSGASTPPPPSRVRTQTRAPVRPTERIQQAEAFAGAPAEGDGSPQNNPVTAPTIADTSDRQTFQAAFRRFWAFLIEERSNGREVVFAPHDGNPRRITRIAGDVMYLVETTKRAGGSSCTRIELRNDFAKLVSDPGWRSLSLQDVRIRHGIKNLVEFKRDMFESFECEFLHPPAV